MGIIGNTQGVSNPARPAANDKKKNTHKELLVFSALSSFVGAMVAGAALRVEPLHRYIRQNHFSQLVA
jgi:hypothetical protein